MKDDVGRFGCIVLTAQVALVADLMADTMATMARNTYGNPSAGCAPHQAAMLAMFGFPNPDDLKSGGTVRRKTHGSTPQTNPVERLEQMPPLTMPQPKTDNIAYDQGYARSSCHAS